MATKKSVVEHQRLRIFQFFNKRFDRLLAALSTFFAGSIYLPPTTTLLGVPESLPLLTEAMVQTRTTSFKTYDLKRKHLHTIEGSGGNPAPRKTSIHRIVRSDWAVSKVTKRSGPRTRKSAKKPVNASSLTAASLLRCEKEEVCCQHCGLFADDPACSSRCYAAFRKEHDAEKLIEIRGPGKHGYGAYSKPGVHLKKGQWLGEYVGQLVPLDVASPSMYRFEIPGVCAIDAGPCGNWTRFVNSSCLPNVGAWTDTIGKRHTVFFQALKDIGPEEELTFNYGKQYFEAAGLKCKCSAMKRPHMPAELQAWLKAKAEK